MNETKFTPGPWRVSKRRNVTLEGTKYYLIEGPNLIRDWGDWGFTEEDAHLIAAAPDMYKELEEALNVFRFYQFHHASKGHSEKEQNNKQYADNIEKVLAKAMGEG